MNIDVNSPLDELLEIWAMYSQKLVYTMLTEKAEIDEFNKVKLVLKTKGIIKLEIHNVYDNEYVLNYLKQGGLFTKRIILNKKVANLE
ncbi:hypothetical protein [Clostridium estertheticum]|uniref:Uncharacterized protein n=2 Tax=Clostridium estertheticum TaxID=238834 RepID=A0A1J0GLK2_9CLOT|nr:hypothetical protein [Clostridium estertheticum]APC42252.1 hypothetical protein A7L45_20420 [Clostridium estertheticum subsp. estertheticum]MBU3073650.1 hypothetical protein [Clostridium estertheticum]MBU3163743.1 hypothetical protein [Clostridium estertheticum]MBU3172237.1 hypothetical protein [Clostridium estertheticum]MBZ9615818.1 hypothetical protein [Clostridium estertheticum subsp. laramiense]